MISYQSSVKIQTRKWYTQRCCEINILHGKELNQVNQHWNLLYIKESLMGSLRNWWMINKGKQECIWLLGQWVYGSLFMISIQDEIKSRNIRAAQRQHHLPGQIWHSKLPPMEKIWIPKLYNFSRSTF